MSLEDRTEAATPHRREEARKEGRVAKSVDASSGVVLLATLMILKAAGPYMLNGMTESMRYSLSHLHNQELTIKTLSSLSLTSMALFAKLCIPLMVGTAVIGLTVNVLQVGLKVTPKSITPDFNKINPMKGIVRLVSMQGLVELLKSILKVVVIGYCVYAFLKNEYPVLLDMASLTPVEFGSVIGGICYRLMIRGAVVMLIIGLLDYIYQKFSFEKSIKMTKQEIKEEYKRTEGDPLIKSKIRARQAEMSRKRMMQDVKKADVIITNPTHFAVAIRYDSNEMSAPTVIAKGQRLMALKIRAIAEANGIPIIENKPVARLLYRTVEVGQSIPEELYQTVAEILAYVYQLNEKAGKAKQSA